MLVVALLAMLMVSTVRYSSFKTVGAGKRSTRMAIVLIASTGMLVWLYSRYVLLAIVACYVLHGPLLRFGSMLRRKSSS